jgi:rhomboid protease GluP
MAAAPVVIGIIVITAASFFVQLMTGGIRGEYTSTLASFPPLIEAGEWWRLITPVLVHANGLHIAFNMFVFYMYGQDVEAAFGHVQLVLIYVVAGITGSAFSFAFGTSSGSVGASGAVFGVVGALLVYLYNRRSSRFMAHHMQGIVSFLLLNTVIGFVLPNIDIMAHLGGFLGGVAMGFGFDRGAKAAHASSPPPLQVITTLCVLGAAAVLVLAA